MTEKIKRVTWSSALAIAATALSRDSKESPDIRSRARTIADRAEVGLPLSAIQIGAIQQLRSRLAGPGASPARKTFEEVWAWAYEGKSALPPPPRFTEIKLLDDGARFAGVMNERSPTDGEFAGYNFSASLFLFLIREAWERGSNEIEGLADGFGPGAGTHGDWSAIRDSSPAAKEKMFQAALNRLFPRRD